MIVASLAWQYPIRFLCALLGLAPSSYYFQPVIRDERALGALVEQVAREYPCYGYRRVTVQLRREQQVVVNHKKVLWLLCLSGLLVRRKGRVCTTDSTHGRGHYPNLLKGLQIERPEQVWSADITYVKLSKGFVYLADAPGERYLLQMVGPRISLEPAGGWGLEAPLSALVFIGAPGALAEASLPALLNHCFATEGDMP